MATRISQPVTLVLVGITGDLARRYLLPAIAGLAKEQLLPEVFHLVGVSRRDVSVADVLKDQADAEALKPFLTMKQLDLDSGPAYTAFAKELGDLEAGTAAERSFYLSVPPDSFTNVVQHLSESGLSDHARVVIEKPFGRDLESAQALVDHLAGHIDEEQLYRVDHYVAKEMVQNIVTLREANTAIRALWCGQMLTRVEVVASESIDIQGRATFYEQTGALRDLVQSHLLQVLAHVIMELPNDMADAESLRAARLAALESLELFGSADDAVIRAQYHGYRDEVENAETTTETFVSLRLRSNLDGWDEVPLIITTGKALAERTSYVRLTLTSGEVIQLQIQPDPKVVMSLTTRKFGFDSDTMQRELVFAYHSSDGHEVDAYWRVMLDVMRSNRHLFISNAEVIASWRVLAPVQAAWARGDADLRFYDKGATPDAIVA